LRRSLSMTTPAHAQGNKVAADALAGYIDFID
jgi:hypothetical protein